MLVSFGSLCPEGFVFLALGFENLIMSQLSNFADNTSFHHKNDETSHDKHVFAASRCCEYLSWLVLSVQTVAIASPNRSLLARVR